MKITLLLLVLAGIIYVSSASYLGQGYLRCRCLNRPASLTIRCPPNQIEVFDCGPGTKSVESVCCKNKGKNEEKSNRQSGGKDGGTRTNDGAVERTRDGDNKHGEKTGGNGNRENNGNKESRGMQGGERPYNKRKTQQNENQRHKQSNGPNGKRRSGDYGEKNNQRPEKNQVGKHSVKDNKRNQNINENDRHRAESYEKEIKPSFEDDDNRGNRIEDDHTKRRRKKKVGGFLNFPMGPLKPPRRG